MFVGFLSEGLIPIFRGMKRNWHGLFGIFWEKPLRLTSDARKGCIMAVILRKREGMPIAVHTGNQL